MPATPALASFRPPLNLFFALGGLQRPSDALTLLERALAIAAATLGEQHVLYGQASSSNAGVLRRHPQPPRRR